MSSNPLSSAVVSVEHVSKKYKLFPSPQARLVEAIYPFKKRHTELLALKDVSFEVPRGQTLGIIGRNGSGKSTLLQLVSGVLQPSAGNIRVQGRIAALLELGAGFNPEVSGRENVMLNGVMMGFSTEEMRRRMPMIEAFAQIGSFIDQPVKTYSSGMFVRLAFSAAIHVDPDILIIDEALAVGDIIFQHKCYQKFQEFQRSGKTILFVTHDMQAIAKHSEEAILFDEGRILQQGKPQDVLHYYHEMVLLGKLNHQAASQSMSRSAGTAVASVDSLLDRFLKETPETDRASSRNSYNPNEYRFGDRRGEILDYLIVADRQIDPILVDSGGSIDIYFKIRFYQNIESPLYGFLFKSLDGVQIYGTNTRFQKIDPRPVRPGDVVIFKFTVKLGLSEGDYFLDLGLAEKLPDSDVPIDLREGVIHLKVRSDKPSTGLAVFETNCREMPVMTTQLQNA